MHAMHGHGHAPPPPRPTSATPVVLRVVFLALTVLSCGLLAWVPMLRLAIVTRTVRDWVLFGLSGVLVVGSLIMIGAEPTEEVDSAQENFGFIVLVATVVAVIAYYLYADIKFEQQRQQGYYGGPVPGPIPGAMPGSALGPTAPSAPSPSYGYPPQGDPHLRTTFVPGSQPPQQPGPRPSPARIDQVRAELDELSDMLRQQDDPGHGHGQGHGQGYGGADGQTNGREDGWR